MATSQPTAALTGQKSQRVYRALLNELRNGIFAVGDQFHTINSICEQHRVSTWTAVKCLDQLVEDGLLTQRQGSGTYVARVLEDPAAAAPPLAQLPSTLSTRCLDYVMPENIGTRAGPEYFHSLLTFIRKHSEDEWMLRLSLLPAHVQSELDVEQWLASRFDAGASAMIFRWMPRIAQEIAVRRGWPVCVQGHPDSGINLPFVDHDQKECGAIAAEHFKQHDCRRVALLMRSEWRPGDNIMINQLLGDLNERLVAVMSCPPTDADVDEAVRQLLSMSPPLDGLFIRNHPGTWLPEHVAELSKRATPLTLITSGWERHAPISAMLPGDEAVFEALAAMAATLADGRPLDQFMVELDVRIEVQS